MNQLTTLLLAMGLSMDAFAISVTRGMCSTRNRTGDALMTAGAFGLFQAVMPIMGYLGGQGLFATLVDLLDHWIAFVLLFAIGVKMIKDSGREENCNYTGRWFQILIAQSVSTSIDALAVGVGMIGFLDNIFPVAAVIGIMTFFLCLAGYFIGKWCGNYLGSKAGLLGGITLITMAFRFLFGKV